MGQLLLRRMFKLTTLFISQSLATSQSPDKND